MLPHHWQAAKRSDCEKLLSHPFLLPGGGISASLPGPEPPVAAWLATPRPA